MSLQKSSQTIFHFTQTGAQVMNRSQAEAAWHVELFPVTVSFPTEKSHLSAALGPGADSQPTPPWITVSLHKRRGTPELPPEQEDRPGAGTLRAEMGKQAKVCGKPLASRNPFISGHSPSVTVGPPGPYKHLHLLLASLFFARNVRSLGSQRSWALAGEASLRSQPPRKPSSFWENLSNLKSLLAALHGGSGHGSVLAGSFAEALGRAPS